MMRLNKSISMVKIYALIVEQPIKTEIKYFKQKSDYSRYLAFILKKNCKYSSFLRIKRQIEEEYVVNFEVEGIRIIYQEFSIRKERNKELILPV